jgi:sensor histidine kinase YesM
MNNKRDTNWIDMANQQNILLSNLSPGNYNVEIRLRDFDNRWPEQFKYFRMIVQPPFWKSTWFIIAASLLLLILIYLLFKWRISRIRKIEREKVQVQELKTAEYRNRLELQIKEEELTRINDQLAAAQLAALQTQMNPHFIFNALNSIKRMILDNEKQNASRYLSKFAQMIRMTLNHSKETFITLQENIEYLHAYLEMEQLRFDDSFAFHIETNNNLDEEDTLVPSLMIQPLVENAIWHGLMHQVGEKQISIRFHQNHDNIICSIEDNGIGIHESEKMKSVNKQPHRSVGLDNLRNRIKIMNEKFDMNCTLDIVDRSERDNHLKGTLALLKFKIINQ